MTDLREALEAVQNDAVLLLNTKSGKQEYAISGETLAKVEAALSSERQESGEAVALLRRLVSAAYAMDVGISKHNQLAPDSPGRLKDIEGPVVSELRSAYCEARNWLATPSQDSREREALAAVVAAARNMPRKTPEGGGASTIHTYPIEACHVWALDAALLKLEAAPSLNSGGEKGYVTSGSSSPVARVTDDAQSQGGAE